MPGHLASIRGATHVWISPSLRSLVRSFSAASGSDEPAKSAPEKKAGKAIDVYQADSGRVMLSGMQALVKVSFLPSISGTLRLGVAAELGEFAFAAGFQISS